jgi:hypothetical protein
MINKELQRKWKEVVVTKPKSLLWHLLRQQKPVTIIGILTEIRTAQPV